MGVPPDAYGVIRSKTHGIDPYLVKPGEFRWVWYRLIPANAETVVFRINPVNRTFSVKGTLPSGDIYARFASIEDNFSWEIDAGFSFSIRPEALVSLVAVNNISQQEELAWYEDDIAKQIEAFILRGMNSEDEFAGYIEALLKNGESPELVQKIQENFPLITNFSIRVKSALVPDVSLYKQTKDLYDTFIAIQKEMLSGNLEDKARSQTESYFRFEELERYGNLLSKYPILLEYLMLEKGGGK